MLAKVFFVQEILWPRGFGPVPCIQIRRCSTRPTALSRDHEREHWRVPTHCHAAAMEALQEVCYIEDRDVGQMVLTRLLHQSSSLPSNYPIIVQQPVEDIGTTLQICRPLCAKKKT